MQINNPLQMNDWEIKKFLKVILAVQLAMWSVIGLDVMDIQTPILRQLIGFIYLTFIPGILILRVLKLHNLGNIETVLYTVGLSIATLMFTGLLMNLLYPFIGISGPISFTPLIITISMVVLVLCILSHIRDKEFSEPSYIDIKNVLSPPALFLCLIPFLAILGSYLVNFYENNILLMLLIVIIALIVVLIGFDKFIPENLYPLAVFIVAISLLFHNSLISMYIWGCDINHELYLANLVMVDSLWDSTIPSNCNAMLSIVMLPPIFSTICDMSPTWVFKIIYPLLFSLLPLGLYHIYQKQTDEKVAFLSVFYFMAIFTFYTEMLALARQEIAEIFFMLIILIMIGKRDLLKRHILLIILGIGLITSHYGLSYLFILLSLGGYIFMTYILKYKSTTYRSNFLMLYILFALSWYLHVSSGSIFEIIITIGSHMYDIMFTEVFTTQAATYVVKTRFSVCGQALRVLYLISQFFILVGFIKILVKRVVQRKEIGFYEEYMAFSAIFFCILAATIITPATGMHIYRFNHIATIILSPFCVIGGIAVFKLINKVVRLSWTDQHMRSSLKILSVFFAIFLLFNSGWANEITDGDDNPKSISLSHDNLLIFRGLKHEQDMISAEWLSVHRDNSIPVYADGYTHPYFIFWAYCLIPQNQLIHVFEAPDEIMMPDDSYVHLSYVNMVWDAFFVHIERGGKLTLCSMRNSTYFQRVHDNKNKIYDNGGNIYV